jgi:uncharacterized lipoprotein YehR (DUF1307 family)
MYNTGGGTNANTMARFRLYSTFGSYVNQNGVALVGTNGSEETQTFTIDLTGISTTEVYVAFQVYKSSSHITVERVWLEK